MSRTAWTLAMAALTATCGGRRGSADFERMRQQQRADAYEASTFFSDGKVMRTPPAGTVAHDGQETSPPAPTPAVLAAGRHHFEIHCAVCHGADGSGRSLMAENMYGSRPPSLLTPAVASQPAGALFELISAGKNRMPSFAWVLPPADRWAVVAYLRTLHPSP